MAEKLTQSLHNGVGNSLSKTLRTIFAMSSSINEYVLGISDAYSLSTSVAQDSR